jgi:phospholipase A1
VPPQEPLVRATPPTVQAAIDADSVILARQRQEDRLWSERLAILPHRPNYFLPASYSPNVVAPLSGDTVKGTEFKFQLSFKLPLLKPVEEGGVAAFFAYTGQSWWQAYDSKRSSPFREYNHEPELFLTWPSLARIGPWTLRSTSLGFVHQSNGRTDPVSRSWNRLFADVRLDHPSGWWLSLRPWVRIPERTKSDPAQAEGDDNPDIRRYLGDGELRFGYGGDQWRLGGLLRRSLVQGGKGAVQLDLTVPTGFSPLVRWYVQLFDGYGESLIDYNRRLLRVGFGLMLNDWY